MASSQMKFLHLCQKVEKATLRLPLCPAYAHGSATAEEKRCKALLGEDYQVIQIWILKVLWYLP